MPPKPPKITAPSSNGRTSGSDPANVGSSPAGATTYDPAEVPTERLQRIDFPPPQRTFTEDLSRQEFIDMAAPVIYSRHFQGFKSFTQAAELWEARKAWLRKELGK